jgi:cyclopropane-fatty-acyl-phospholipid synthase
VFADLAGYTALTEAHSDERAAEVAAAFCDELRALLATPLGPLRGGVRIGLARDHGAGFGSRARHVSGVAGGQNDSRRSIGLGLVTHRRPYSVPSVMADRKHIDFTYSLTDRIIRHSLGELADFSGAKYDGDFSLTLEQAQRRKHEYVAEQIRLSPGRRVLDLGCGWGSLLNYIRGRGGIGVGVTLSSAQLATCQRHGLDVHLHDAREVNRERFGAFDAVASLGAFEHFCSPEDYQGGRQEEIYRGLFARVANLLPGEGRFYLQTMVFGDKMIPAEQIDIEALRAVPPRDSDEWYIALLGRQFPGSWLPFGREQVIRCAKPHFSLVSSISGRLDYIETIRQWNERIGARTLRKTLLKLQLLPRWLASADFRLAFSTGVSSNKVCFERQLLDHYRLVFEKSAPAADSQPATESGIRAGD